ncbi:MAG: AraC family transcriptional regulator [Proteobacteria bacterium]|nr:AraC family transcriptional regulator [Pseudomonadota bacterium]
MLQHSPSPGSYRHTRHAPSPVLANWVLHFWIETWDWDGAAPQRREVLPHPCVHLAFVPGRSRIFGVQLSKFSRELRGQGRVVGVKFRPGAFYPFLHRPVSTIANSSLPLQELFIGAADAEREMFARSNDAEIIEVASRFIAERLPQEDPAVGTACEIVEAIATDKAITRVQHILARWETKERTLQRLFARYVGASARWVIKRYRVYESLESLDSDPYPDWARLALELGYFDQAHFINDFRKLVGCTPVDYHRACRSTTSLRN